MGKYEVDLDYREIYKLMPIDTIEENSLITKEKKEYGKPQIETIDRELNERSENTLGDAG